MEKLKHILKLAYNIFPIKFPCVPCRSVVLHRERKVISVIIYRVIYFPLHGVCLYFVFDWPTDFGPARPSGPLLTEGERGRGGLWPPRWSRLSEKDKHREYKQNYEYSRNYVVKTISGHKLDRNNGLLNKEMTEPSFSPFGIQKISGSAFKRGGRNQTRTSCRCFLVFLLH